MRPACFALIGFFLVEVSAEPQAAQSEQRLGPFSIVGQKYTVVLYNRKRAPGTTQETGETLVAMEIRDAAGAVQYRRTFPYQTGAVEFSDAWSVSAGILAGKHGTGLLVNYDCDSEPSAPEPEPSSWWQLFGVVNGKLKPFGGPLQVQGGLLPGQEIGKRLTTVSPDPQSDALEFKVWSKHFRLVFPVRIDWTRGKLALAQSCEVCQYKVLPEQDRRVEDLTFVRFCPNPGRKCEKPERVLVKATSKVELVAAQVNVKWSEGSASAPSGNSDKPMDDEGAIALTGDDLWLKLRIDGKDGWIYSEEDFNALGLPFEQ